jgi:hypothetical protein
MEVYSLLTQVTFNNLGPNERASIVTGLTKQHDDTFTFTMKHFGFVNMEDLKKQNYTIKLCHSTGKNDHFNNVLSKCANNDLAQETVQLIGDYYDKFPNDGTDEFVLQIFDGVETIGWCRFICLENVQFKCVFIMNSY